MSNSDKNGASADIESLENQEWLESLDYVLKNAVPELAAELL